MKFGVLCFVGEKCKCLVYQYDGNERLIKYVTLVCLFCYTHVPWMLYKAYLMGLKDEKSAHS